MLIDDITDHLPRLCILPRLDVKCAIKTHTSLKRKVNVESIDNFKVMFNKVNWNFVYGVENVNVAFDLFHEKFIALFDAFCPLVKMAERKQHDKPWLTKGHKFQL